MTSDPAPPVFWDRIGISLSGLCMVHCMVMPLVLAALPLWSRAETLHDWFHAPEQALRLVTTAL